MTNVITFAMPKGGAGKTTMIYNFAEFLSQIKEEKVLLVDLDHQASLSETYGFIDTDKTSIGLFTKKEVQVHNIHKNLDFIPACFELEEIPMEFRARGVQRIHFLIEEWLIDHEYVNEYDYILFDTHPDTLTVTQNAIATSNYQVAIIEPSFYGYNAIPKTEVALDNLKSETYDRFSNSFHVTTELVFVLNKLIPSREMTKNLLESVQENNIPITAEFKSHAAWGKTTSDNVPIFSIPDFPKKYIEPILDQFERLYQKIKS